MKKTRPEKWLKTSAAGFPGRFRLYLSPVGFQSSIVPYRFRLLYSLNPMVGIIDGFRWVLIGCAEQDLSAVPRYFDRRGRRNSGIRRSVLPKNRAHLC